METKLTFVEQKDPIREGGGGTQVYLRPHATNQHHDTRQKTSHFISSDRSESHETSVVLGTQIPGGPHFTL